MLLLNSNTIYKKPYGTKKFWGLSIFFPVLFAILLLSTGDACATSPWMDSSWSLKIPVTITKPVGYESANYSNKTVEAVLNFSAYGVDNVDSNSIRVGRYFNSVWTELPSATSAWLDQSAPVGYDGCTVKFVTYIDDLDEVTETSITYYVFFDLLPNGPKSAPGYTSIATIDLLCADFAGSSQVCEEMATITAVGDYSINVTTTSQLSALLYANLTAYDILYFGWFAVSDGGTYKIDGYTTDILNFTNNGGRTLCVANDNIGFGNTWLPDAPGTMGNAVNPGPTINSPYDTTIFGYPHANALNGTRLQNKYSTFPAGYDVMAAKVTDPLFMRKYWGAGTYILGNIQADTAARATAAHNYFENSIYWALSWTGQPLAQGQGTMERYSVTSLDIYQSDYSTPMTTAMVGNTIYIQVVAADLNTAAVNTLQVRVKSDSDPTGITVTLTETGVSSGIYRGTAVLDVSSNGATSRIQADSLETVTVESLSANIISDSLSVGYSNPSAYTSLDFKTDGTYVVTLADSLTIGSNLYMEVVATDSNSVSSDVVSVKLTSNSDAVGITVNLRETGRSTGIFRGIATVMETSDDGSDYIKAQDDNTVVAVVVPNPATTDSVYVASSPPLSITSVKIYESNYTTDKTTASGGQTFYVELIGVDGNQYGVDYTAVSVVSSATDPSGISVRLTETGIHTGIYRGFASTGAVSSEVNDIIGAKNIGETVTVASNVNPSKLDTFTIINTPPVVITSVILKTNGTYTTDLVSGLIGGSTLYIELTATDANINTKDVTTVNVYSEQTDPTGISVTLTESGAATGKYRGTATIKTASNDTLDQIGAVVFETITIKSNVDVTKTDTVQVVSSQPSSITSVTYMTDVTYSSPLLTDVSVGQSLYIEVVGTDTNAQAADATDVSIISSSDLTGISVTLIESGLNTGRYRGFATVKTTSNDSLNYIMATSGDVVTVKAVVDVTKTDAVNITGTPPKGVFSIALFQSNYTTPLVSAQGGATIYVEAKGVDGNTVASNDISTVKVTSTSDPTGITVTLNENSGTAYNKSYRGTVIVGAQSNQAAKTIKAAPSDTITIKSDGYAHFENGSGEIWFECESANMITPNMTISAGSGVSGGSFILTPQGSYNGEAEIVIYKSSAGSQAFNLYGRLWPEDSKGRLFLKSVDGGAETNFQSSAGFGTWAEPWDSSTGYTLAQGAHVFKIRNNSIDNDATRCDKAVLKKVAGAPTAYGGAPIKTYPSSAANVLNTEPTAITAVDLKTNNTYATSLTTNVESGFTLYIELTATDANQYTADSTNVTVKSSITDPAGISVKLTESGVNTGKYRGIATIAAVSNDASDIIGAATTETITIKSTVDAGKLDTVTVNTPAQLQIDTVTTTPTTVSHGQTGIVVSFTVNNTGTAPANVSTANLSFTNNGDFDVTPNPANPSQVAGGTTGVSFSFTVTVHANAANGLNTIDGSITATDALSGSPASDTGATTTDSFTVQAEAALTSSIAGAPSQVSQGQVITVSMTVNNTGQSSANTVIPSALTKGGTGTATYVSGPTPTNATIPGGGNQVFTWTYTAVNTGTINFTGNASGTDANSGSPISSGSSGSLDVTIKVPAALSSSITASPGILNQGGTIIVTMTVNNTGGTTANNTAPTAPVLGGTSTASYISGPSPASANVIAGGQQIFTWTYAAGSQNGTVNFTSHAAGTDANSGSPVSSTDSTSPNVSVQVGCALAVAITSSPVTVSDGQTITVRMTATNSGQSGCSAVTPSSLTKGGTGSAAYISGSTPASATIAGGANQIFTWTYTASAVAGNINFTGNVSGNDSVSGSPISSSNGTSNDTTVELKAHIDATIFSATPTTVSTNQNITVSMTVANLGGADATGVVPSNLTVSGTAGATKISGPTPASQTIPGSSNRVYSWIYKANGTPGTLSFFGTATGLDENSGNAASTPIEISNNVTVQNAASISHTIVASPSTANNSQLITVTMAVSNSGQVATNNVTPSALTLGGTSSATIASGPTPASATIVGGGNQNFTWTYNADAVTTGTVDFSGSAAGTDANSGAAVATGGGSSNAVTVMTPAVLICTITSAPDLLGVGDPITVTMSCDNTGETAVNNVVGSALALGGTGSSVYVSGPIPGSATIAGGGSQNFTYAYTAAVIGTINYTGNASGTDANTGSPVTSNQAVSDNTVITGNPDAVLSSTISVTPSMVNTGSTITVKMTVTNVGEASASSVVPSALTVGGTGGATLSSGPSPASANISENGGSQIFTWTYTASSAGTINFTGNATGNNDGIPPPLTVSSQVSSSSDITAQTPAVLASSISIPASMNHSQQITVSMTVNNTGGATASGVAPSALTIGGTSGAVIVSGPTPATANIAGGANQIFTWTYTANAVSGTLKFTGKATGTDVNSGSPVSSTSGTSNTASVQTAASISTVNTTVQTIVSGGQKIAIGFKITNSGQATAVGFVPSAITVGGTGAAIYFAGPTPATTDVPGGTSRTIWWQYTASNIDSVVNFTASATGADGNTSAPLLTGDVITPDVTVQKKPVLTETIAATPASVSYGQTVTVSMTISNTGTATANTVTPSALTIGGTSSGAALLSGPTPASANIAGGANQVFTWTYSAGGTSGTLNFAGNAAGTDANNATYPVSSTSKTTNNVTVQSASALTSSIGVSPASLATGYAITVSMTVNNTGQGTANSVAPSVLTLGGSSGDATLASGPTPASANIIGGGNQVYTWTYTAGATLGSVNFTGNVSGTDANTGSPVSSSANASGNVTILGSASIATSITVPPNVITNSLITVTMNITNSGSGAATNVTPSTLTLGGTSIANYTSGPTPASIATLNGSGGTGSFTWTYTASSDVGTVDFTGNASGTDQNTLLPVSSTANTSNTLAINNLTPTWVYPASGAIGSVRSSASVRNNVAYIGSDDNYLYAINMGDGSLRWRHNSRDDVVSWPYPIDWAPPMTIYYGSMGNYAYAINDNGQGSDASAWGSDGVNVGNRIVSTTVSDGVGMYFGCFDDKVHALNVANGVPLWTSLTLNGDLISSPSLFNTDLYIGSTDGNLYALNVANGAYLRSFNTGGNVEGMPWTDPDGSIYVGSSSGKFYALNSSNFTQKWVYPEVATQTIGAVISSPWVEGFAVYFGSNDGKVYALNKYNGKPINSFVPFQAGAAVRSSPLAWNGVLYFGSDDGNFYAINAITGALLPGWPYYDGSVIFSSPSVDYDNNKIIIGSNSGKIYCFDAATP